MRILYFSRDYTPHDYRFLAALAGTVHEIAYLRFEQNPHPSERRDLPARIRLIQWNGGRKASGWIAGLRLAFDLRQIIDIYQPDIIHAGPLQSAAFITALAKFQPLVSMSWGYDILMDASRNLFLDWATRYTLRQSSVLFADCQAVRKAAETYGMDEKRIVIFPWGVDLNIFHPAVMDVLQRKPENTTLRQRLGWGENTFVLLSARSWAPLYGTLELVQAFLIALEKLPHLRLIMLGGGTQSAQIVALLQEAGVAHKVYVAGQVHNQDLVEYYNSADLYVSASHTDGTSISLLEALACGCPVLVSDIPGNTEWITVGETGWRFPAGNVQALAQAMTQAWSCRQELPRMGVAARQLVEKRADWNENFTRMLEGYEMALRDKIVCGL